MTKRLTKVLAVLGGMAVALAILSAIAMLVTVRRGFSARDQPSKLETVLARSMRSWSIPSSARELRNPVQSSAGVVAEARAHWADHCAICHANDGGGDTEIGRNLYPKAPDMRTPATQGLSDGELYYIIENGVRLTGMPGWGGGHEGGEDSWKLVAFIRHLPELTAPELREMERLNPKGPEERKEEQNEDDFLRGAKSTAPEPPHGHH